MASEGNAGPVSAQRIRFGVQPDQEGALRDNQEGAHHGNGITGPTRGIVRSSSMRRPSKKPVVMRSATPFSDYGSAGDPDEDEGVSEDTFVTQRANLAGSTGINHVAFMPYQLQMHQTAGKTFGFVNLNGHPALLVPTMPDGTVYSPPMLPPVLPPPPENDSEKLSAEEYDLHMARYSKQGGLGTLTSGRDVVRQFPPNPKVTMDNILTPTTMGRFVYPSPEKTPKARLIDQLVELAKKLENITYQSITYNGDTLSVSVPHYDMYNSIWMWMYEPSCAEEFSRHLNDYEGCLEKIFDTLFAAKSESEPPLQLQEIVILKSQIRGRCARGRIHRLRGDHETALVQLLDYGTLECVLLADMVRQPAEMRDFNFVLAWRCKMREIDYSFTAEDATYFEKEFAKTMERKDLQVRVLVSATGNWLDVVLEHGTKEGGYTDVGQKLQKLGSQSPLVTMGPRESSPLTKGETVVIMRLVNVENAGTLHCCPLKTDETREQIRKIHLALKKTFDGSWEPFTLPEPGVLVAVQHNEQWMRARVLRTEYDATCFLYFVDLGRVGYTPTANIRRLLQEQANVAALSLICYVKDACKALEGHYEQVVNDKARKLLEDANMLRADVPFKVDKFIRAGNMTLGDSDEDTAEVSLTLTDGRDYVAALMDAIESGKNTQQKS